MKFRLGGLKPVIGLIGGIGAGKSTAARCFERRGGYVVDADKIGHAALQDPPICEEIVQRWGEGVKKPDGSLDRRAIAQIVFANPEERNVLQKIVFPFIGERCKRQIAAAQQNPNVRFVVLDAAVMLEAGWNEIADLIVYLDVPRELRLFRVANRSGWTDSELTARESAQWPEERKKGLADAILRNDASPDQLQGHIDRLLSDWGLLREG